MSVLPANAPPHSAVSTADVPADLLRAIVEHTASANSLWQPVFDADGTLIDFSYIFINPAAKRFVFKAKRLWVLLKGTKGSV